MLTSDHRTCAHCCGCGQGLRWEQDERSGAKHAQAVPQDRAKASKGCTAASVCPHGGSLTPDACGHAQGLPGISRSAKPRAPRGCYPREPQGLYSTGYNGNVWVKGKGVCKPSGDWYEGMPYFDMLWSTEQGPGCPHGHHLPAVLRQQVFCALGLFLQERL